MTMKLFAVRDVKADCYGAPMSVATKGIAVRGFQEACLDSRSEISKYPEDYSLYEIGEYDPNSGLVTAHSVPQFVASASGLIMAHSKARLVHEPTLPNVLEEVSK